MTRNVVHAVLDMLAYAGTAWCPHLLVLIALRGRKEPEFPFMAKLDMPRLPGSKRVLESSRLKLKADPPCIRETRLLLHSPAELHNFHLQEGENA